MTTQELLTNTKSFKDRDEKERNSSLVRITRCKEESEVKLSYNHSITRQNLITFGDNGKKEKATSIPEDEGQSFVDILTGYDKNLLDFEYLVMWPVTTRPFCFLYKV